MPQARAQKVVFKIGEEPLFAELPLYTRRRKFMPVIPRIVDVGHKVMLRIRKTRYALKAALRKPFSTVEETRIPRRKQFLPIAQSSKILG